VGDTKIKLIDSSWEGEVLISAYAGNMYVIDREDSKIFRFAGSGDAFGPKSSWLAPGIEIDLSKIISMAVDGAIWILSSSGNVERYLQGSPQTLETKISPNLLSPVDIYTNEELEGVYVLDPKNKRVVVLGKEGNYIAQYKNEKLGNATFLVASESEGRIIFLAENKLYSIEIKH